MKPKIPLIIDCDPGIDDSFAIFYSHLSDAFDIKAIVSVAGNVPIEMTTQNAGFLISKIGKAIPLIKGAVKPLVGEPIIAKYAHGANGLGGYLYEGDYASSAIQSNPTDYYYQLLSSSPEPITIAAIGPLTNLAKLFLAYPDAVKYIEKITVMGGGIKVGNYTASAEFNIAADPLAAQIVLNSKVKLEFVPLDTTEAIGFENDFVNFLKTSSNPLSNLLYDIVDAKYRFDETHQKVKLYLHDMVTLISIIHPEWFDLIDTHVAVELHGKLTKGETIFDLRQDRANTPNSVYVAFKERNALIKHVMEVLS
jgi:inosine-uridine nucleoside N-ribohydrolase